MSKINDGGPAFPDCGNILKGMSLRDYFAGQAMASMIPEGGSKYSSVAGLFARASYEYADAMLAARTKGGA